MPQLQSPERRRELQRAVSEAILRHKHDYRPAFQRRRRKKAPRPLNIVAYDLETTSIKIGTPRPVCLTAFGVGFDIDTAIRGPDLETALKHLCGILRSQFLTREMENTAFVAWNANRFDAYIVAAALVREPDLVIRPYMTKSKALRGMRIVLKENQYKKNAPCWQFLDGIAMTGLVGTSLEKFVANFAPDFPKLTEAIDFDREEFNPDNPDHRRYAFRDSEGLFYAMRRAQQIMLQTFEEPLSVTMGGVCIKIFAAHIPEGVKVDALIPDLSAIVSRFVMRGGFCYCNRRYFGPVWKYDLNQAYASAMRETALPAGTALHAKTIPPKSFKGAYIARINATHPDNKIPFYCRQVDDLGRVRSTFATAEIRDTWLTSVEVEQLALEGWRIKTLDCWMWPDTFNMKDFVDKLERLRTTCDGGPSGPIGTMVKATGNHSYGKTVEKIEPIEFILAAECPDDALPYYGDGTDPIEHIYYRIDDDRKPKDYHQPHLGAWITAYVRMVVRRAALIDPAAWLYADTDCVIFSRDVSQHLDIDPKRYGAWKIEEEGTPYQIIAKKVYTQVGTDKPKRSAKGMIVKRLTADDFSRWYEGTPPKQDQVQLQNFLSVIRGAEMFRSQTRKGTFVEALTD